MKLNVQHATSARHHTCFNNTVAHTLFDDRTIFIVIESLVMSLVDTVPIDFKQESDKETKTKSTIDSTEHNSDEKSNYSVEAISVNSKPTPNLSQESSNGEKLERSPSSLSSLKDPNDHESNILYDIPNIIDENDDDDLSMNSHLEDKISKSMEIMRLEQQLEWKEDEMKRREEKNKWKEDSIDQWTAELAHREKEMNKREQILISREMHVEEMEQNLSLIKEELNLDEMDIREYLNKQESIQQRRDDLKARSDSMKKKNHEAMEKLMKIADRSVNNIQDLFKYFDLPTNLNERLSEPVYLNLFRSFFHELKQSESNQSTLSSSSSVESDSIASNQMNRRSLLTKYKTFEAKMFFLLTERDVVILNLKRKLVEKDQDTLAKEYAIRHKDVTNDDHSAFEEIVATEQKRRGSLASLGAISEASGNNESRSLSIVKVNGYIKSKQSLERRRVELLHSMTSIQQRNEEDLVKRVEYLKKKETNIMTLDESLNLKEMELRQKEEDLKNKRNSLITIDMSQKSLVSLDSQKPDRTKPLQMENLDKTIQISMRKDEEAVEALKSELVATESAVEGKLQSFYNTNLVFTFLTIIKCEFLSQS